MSNKNPYFTRLSCWLTVVLIAGLVIILGVVGKGMFSPGPLTAAHPQNQPLQGFTSHADFEAECGRCHAPLMGPTAERCLACHLTVDEQLKEENGLHSAITDVERCDLCHLDHLGREARITRLDTRHFPHEEATGFSLAHHMVNFGSSPLECVDCHAGNSYTFELPTCSGCHTEAQAAFMAEHQARAGDACLACHDGSGRMAQFEHSNFFVLEGAHTGVGCVDCHPNNQFQNTPRDCFGCHAADDPHHGELGAECSACHSATVWQEATLVDHTFPLTHRNNGRQIECQVCHQRPTFKIYTCYGCHEHNPAGIENKHREEGIYDILQCANCHPTGSEHERDDNDEKAHQEYEGDENNDDGSFDD